MSASTDASDAPAKPRIILGVGGGIAAYKACEVLRRLTESGHSVRVIPTEGALKFVGAATFEALSGEVVSADPFDDVHEVPHVKLGQNADLVVVAPATANLIAKAAHGLADDLLTNTLLTARCPVLLVPAMHTEMWEHPATQHNVELLRSRGVIVAEPASGRLTGKDTGKGRLPDTVIAAIGGGSNAMGLFFPFLDDPSVNIIGVEAGGKGVDDRMQHCASLTGGRPGVLHGNRTYLLQDPDGQILEGFSISAGLDYPGIGPEHAWLHDIGRAKYVSITDAEALEAFQLSCKLEGIIPALEPSHALAHVMKIAPTLPRDHIIVMNMCGRGDKDIFTVAKHLGFDMKV